MFFNHGKHCWRIIPLFSELCNGFTPQLSPINLIRRRHDLRYRFFGLVAVLTFLVPIWGALADGEGESDKAIAFSGALEGELDALWSDEAESQFTLATAQLGMDVSLAKQAGGHLVLLYEQGENDDNIAVDEATIDLLLLTADPLEIGLSVGRMYVPFGEFDSHFVADPFTLEIGETNQVALQLSASYGVAKLLTAIYNGNVSQCESGASHVSDMAAKIVVAPSLGFLAKSLDASFGASFITDISQSDGLLDVIAGDGISKGAMGLEGFIRASAKGVFLVAEFAGALSDIQLLDAEKMKPHSFNVELGCSLHHLPMEVALKFEQLSLAAESTTNRFGAALSHSFFDDAVSFTLELLRTLDDEAKETSVVSQLAVEF